MTITKTEFGVTQENETVEKFTIVNQNRITMELISYGATLLSLKVPDRDKKPGEVTLGFGKLEPYLAEHPYFGATVGRFANRIENAQFSLGPRRVHLQKNEPPNHLHGGVRGFNRYVWSAEAFALYGGAGVRFSRLSAHNEEGYPGKLQVSVTYTLTDQNELVIDYHATTNRATPVNLTNHTYWNLAGPENGSILNHDLQLSCDRFLPVRDDLIPTGEVIDVAGTPMDFRKAKRLGADIQNVPGGYDHCFVVNERREPLAPVAMLWDRKSGRAMEVLSTKPAVQVYTGNKLDGIPGRNGLIIKKHSGVCLETQFYPNAVNEPSFPSCILKPREEYRHQTVHRFLTR
ncbi:MAG: aldose epimerase family protein [Spirochaetaceae bacterium]